MSSQGSFEATSPLAGPSTPSAAAPSGPAARRDDGASSAAVPPPLNHHMLPLQHLLMSDRAQMLTSLEVKAIVYKVMLVPGGG